MNNLNDDCDIDFHVSPEYFANGANATFKTFLRDKTSFANITGRDQSTKSHIEAIGDLAAFKQRRVHIQSADHTMNSVAQHLRSFMCDEILEKDNVNYSVWLQKQKEQITDIKNQLLESINITINKDEHHERLSHICTPILLFKYMQDYDKLCQRASDEEIIENFKHSTDFLNLARDELVSRFRAEFIALEEELKTKFASIEDISKVKDLILTLEEVFHRDCAKSHEFIATTGLW